jgi:AraC family transcriptional regulator, transcriptional activator FtrA
MDTVAAVIDQGALTFDFAIPCEIFGLDRSDIVDPWYEFLVVAAGDRRVRTQTGFVIEAPHGLDALERAETIVVPGWADPDEEPSAALKESLVGAYERGARLVSVCTGAFVLAAAGLLDGRRATTHWMYAERLARRYPRVRLDPDVLYLADGRVFTSAGTAAGIDLCLHLVALDHGVEVAATVARRLVMPLYRLGGQAQYVDTPIAPDPGGLAALLDWGRANLDAGITVDDLVRRGAVSPRTLTRRFRAAAGMPPGECSTASACAWRSACSSGRTTQSTWSRAAPATTRQSRCGRSSRRGYRRRLAPIARRSAAAALQRCKFRRRQRRS